MSPYTSRLLTLTMKVANLTFWYAQLAKSAYIADQTADRNAYAQIKIQIDLLTQHILQIEMQIDLLTEHTLQIALQNVLLCISNFIFDTDTYHSILALPWYASLAWKKDKRL